MLSEIIKLKEYLSLFYIKAIIEFELGCNSHSLFPSIKNICDVFAKRPRMKSNAAKNALKIPKRG